MESQTNKRVPVLSPSGRVMMPTTASRARRWLKEGKAKIVQNDLNVFQIQLLFEPSGYETQPISCGLDPGSDFTGVAVQSKNETLIGLNLNLPRKQVHKRMTERAQLRRCRRGRRIKRNGSFKLRNHREKRFDNRKQSKLPPSILANKQLELRVIKELLAIYPISHFYVEMLNKSNAPGFTRAAQGQKYIVKEIELLGDCTLIEGWQTSNRREHLKLPKSKDKGEQTPAAHVNDAISLASFHFLRYARNTSGNQTGYLVKGKMSVTKFTFGTVSRLPSRPRKMHDLTIKKGGTRDTYGGFQGTHSYRNGDVVAYETKRSKLLGVISACDLYQFFPEKKRLKQGITNRYSRLIKPNCNLLVNII